MLSKSNKKCYPKATKYVIQKQQKMLSKSNKICYPKATKYVIQKQQKKNLKAKPKKYFIQKQNNIASKSIIIMYLHVYIWSFFPGMIFTLKLP